MLKTLFLLHYLIILCNFLLLLLHLWKIFGPYDQLMKMIMMVVGFHPKTTCMLFMVKSNDPNLSQTQNKPLLCGFLWENHYLNHIFLPKPWFIHFKLIHLFKPSCMCWKSSLDAWWLKYDAIKPQTHACM